MADNNLDWWGKGEPKTEGVKGSVKRRTAASTKQSRKRAPRQPKAPLSKMALTLRALKHTLYMLAIIVAGAVVAHYTLTTITRHNAKCSVPQLEMLTMAEAEALVEKDELKLIINDSLYAPTYRRGVILDQLPKAGVVVKPGRAIYLTVNATQRRMVDVPYVAERSLRQAKNMLEIAGLSIGGLIYEDDLARNYILSQEVDGEKITPNSDLRAPVGTEVTLYVGRGDDDSTLVPMLLGMSLREAKSELLNAGLNVGETKYDEAQGDEHNDAPQARIYSQSSRAESELIFGDSISLELSSSTKRVDTMIRNYYRMLQEERELLKLMEEMDAMMLLEEMDFEGFSGDEEFDNLDE